tara:strand:+ start:592 stop:966 length:375 start_codon:yes stop_codon:yes gene_type:complete
MITDMDIEEDINFLCSKVKSVKVVDKINLHLIQDLDIIIREIINNKSLFFDVYEICVSCGHNLTWDYNYFINNTDLQWLKTKGKDRFFENIRYWLPITTLEEYNSLSNSFDKLIELFELQVQDD